MYIHETFYCIKDLVDTILDSEYADNVTIICKYDSAVAVLKELLDGTDLMPTHISINDAMWDGYDKEFIISTLDGDIYCENFFRDKYIHVGDDVTFLLPDCSDECVEHVKNDIEKGQVCFGIEFTCDYDDCEEECVNTDVDVDIISDANGVIGFKKSTTSKLDGDGTMTSSFTVITHDSDFLKLIAEAFDIKI